MPVLVATINYLPKVMGGWGRSLFVPRDGLRPGLRRGDAPSESVVASVCSWLIPGAGSSIFRMEIMAEVKDTFWC